MKTLRPFVVVALLGCISACGGNDTIDYTCDEPQTYQAVTEGKRIVPPEGLDPLNEFAEMPIPKSQDAPVRPAGARCIELPPSVQTDG